MKTNNGRRSRLVSDPKIERLQVRAAQEHDEEVADRLKELANRHRRQKLNQQSERSLNF